MAPRKGRKRTAVSPVPDSRVTPQQPTGPPDGPAVPQPGPSHTNTDSASTSSYGETDLSATSSSNNPSRLSLFPSISGIMGDPITRWTVEHSEKQRLVDLEVTDIRSKIKHIENLLKEELVWKL